MDGNGTTVAILIGVWATFALDVYSTLNSSPQTTELFARDRVATLIVSVAMLGLYKHAVKRGQGVAPPADADGR